jgi:hydroxymethylbilane synthase
MHLRAVVISPDRTKVIRRESDGAAADAAELGRTLAEELLAAGGREILDEVYGKDASKLQV